MFFTWRAEQHLSEPPWMHLCTWLHVSSCMFVRCRCTNKRGWVCVIFLLKKKFLNKCLFNVCRMGNESPNGLSAFVVGFWLMTFRVGGDLVRCRLRLYMSGRLIQAKTFWASLHILSWPGKDIGVKVTMFIITTVMKMPKHWCLSYIRWSAH